MSGNVKRSECPVILLGMVRLTFLKNSAKFTFKWKPIVKTVLKESPLVRTWNELLCSNYLFAKPFRQYILKMPMEERRNRISDGESIIKS